MAQQNRATIKTYFETGDVPTQSQFANSFDSQVFWQDDVETDLTSNSDSKVPTVKAVVDGIATKQDILTAGNMHTYVDSLTPLTTPADADRMIIVDNSASLAKKITWANIKATLATTFQAVLTAANFGAFLTGLTAKNTLVDADEVLSSDSAASNVSKKTSWLNVWTNYIKAKADLVYSTIASPTFTGTVTTPAIIVSSETASRVAIIDASKNVKSGDTATYPSLTELARVKGVTSAIQTQINARRKTLQSTGLGSAVTLTTTITLSKSILIPANTFVAGDIPKVTTRIVKSGGVGGYTPRMYLNTANNLSGAILVGTGYVADNTNRASGMERVISIEVATGANTFVHNTTNAIGLECINYTGSESTLTIDWTVDQYLLVAIQLTSSITDSANCRHILIN